MAIEAKRVSAIRLAGRNGKQPTVILQRVVQLRDALEQGFLDPTFGSGSLEMQFVAFRKQDVPFVLFMRRQLRDRLDKAEADDLSAHFRRRDDNAMLGEGRGQSVENVRAAVDQSPVAIENGKLIHSLKPLLRSPG